MRIAPTRRSQHGVSLLLFLFIVLCLSTTFFITSLSSDTARLALDKRTEEALAAAKEALIGRAARDDNRPGSLPCPDTNGDGLAESFSGPNCPAYIGRFPYKTLKTGELRDASGELLWYVLSPSLRDHPSASPINLNTPATLSLDAVSNVAAIIIAPGSPLPGQNGRPSNLISDYLDGSNADGNSGYITTPLSAAFNDKAIALLKSELFSAVSRRILGDIRGPDDQAPFFPNKGLRAYGAPLPWADDTKDGWADPNVTSGKLPYNNLTLDSWLTNNDWPTLVNYTRLSANSAQISIGSTTLKIVPCLALPCP